MTYEIQLLPGQPINSPIRGETLDTYVGMLKAGELVKRYQIPHRNYEGDTGYQRLPTNSRVRKLANDMHERMVDLPTALLLSVRDRNLRPRLEASGRYVLTLPKDNSKPFYVVDGQHRLQALDTVIEEERDGHWSEYRIPAVIFFGSDEYVEMDQFHTVNSNAKSIKTDLALDLLTKRAQMHGEFRDHLYVRNQLWQVNAQELTALVAKRGVWIGRIRFPNEKKGTTIITSNSFVSSLKRVLDQENFSAHSLEERSRIVDAYWRGIEKVLPECFRTPKRYNIQKTVGAFVLHDLLSFVMLHANRYGKPLDNPDSYAGILRKTLRRIRGENLSGDEAIGPDYWKAGAEGVAGVYSSGSGRQRLVQLIKKALQEDLQVQ